jgi:GT2 family glycosyltransferase
MTSLLTTGGLRGNKKMKSKFQPRSFNMGISKKAFIETNGFSKRKIGEDIDLSFRLWKKGFETQLIPDAFVYHKRRNTINSFFIQTYRFGRERPVLNKQYPGTAKLTYWFPCVFVLGVLFSSITLFFHCFLPFITLMLYFFAILIDSSLKNKSSKVGIYSILTSIVQFFGYGLGFITGLLRRFF